MPDSIHAGTQLAHRRVQTVQMLLVFGILVKLLAIASAFAQSSMLLEVANGAELSPAAARANDSRERLLAVASILLFLGTAVCWLRWQHRAYANLGLIGSGDTEYTPGWSVGYWFIPIVNIFRPYQITAELYRRSEIQNRRDTIGGLSSSPLVVAWWVTYIAWGVSLRWYTSLLDGATTIGTLISAIDMELIAHIIGLVATVLAIVLVNAIDRFQQAFQVTDPITAR